MSLDSSSSPYIKWFLDPLTILGIPREQNCLGKTENTARVYSPLFLILQHYMA